MIHFFSVLRGSVPDRHRHDEFIWALIFSLIINLLFVFVLLAQRYVKKSQSLQPFVVSIAMNRQALPRQAPTIPGPTAIPAPAKTKKTAEPPPNLQPQRTNINPTLPTRDNDIEATISPVIVTKRAETETVLPPLATAGASATAPIGKEITGGPSILGDKMTGEHYTAPEYLLGEKPPYPRRAERNGWEGTVLLSLTINASGEVEKVGIVKTSGYELLDHQARESVSAWRFKPARRNGIAIAVTVQQPIIFRPTPPENDQ